MLNLKYNNSEKNYEIEFSKISDYIVDIVDITGTLPIQTDGFTLSRPGRQDYWDYSKFKTIYRTFDDSMHVMHVQFSNDESVYIAPPEPEPTQEPEPYEPTQEELEAMFKQNKMHKIVLSKTMLAEYLENNPLHSSAHGGIDGVYSVTSEKQSLMMSQYMTYQIEKDVNPDAKLTWNETGKSCTEWTEEEFLQLILEVKAYVYPLVSLQQQIEEQIEDCTNQEELDIITIDYSVIKQV